MKFVPQASKETSRAFFLEILIGLGLITFVNLTFFSEQPGFLDVAPHPYWLVIIPIAVRYGFTPALMVSLLSGILYFGFLAASIPDPSLGDLKNFDGLWKPITFLAVGMILGELRQVQINRYIEVVDRKDEVEKALKRLSEQYTALMRAKEEVDSRIVSQKDTVATLYSATAELRALENEGIFHGIMNIMGDFLGATACSIYQVQDNRLVLKRSQGDHPAPMPKFIESGAGLPGMAFKTGAVQSLSKESEEDIAEAGTCLSVPIALNTGEIFAVLNIDRIPFIKFTEDTVELAGLVADWCAASLENALVYKETKDKLIADDVLDAYRFEYFGRRMEEEFARARRYKLDLSLIAMELDGFDEMDESLQSGVLMEFSLALKNVLRNIDLIFLDKDYGKFLIMLPTTGPEGARVVAGKLVDAMRGITLGAMSKTGHAEAVRYGLSWYEPGVESGDRLYEQSKSRMTRVELS